MLKAGLYSICGYLLLSLIVLPAAAKPPVTTIYLVRHAEKDLTPGLTDPPLAPAGEARARLLAQRLRRYHPAALFTTTDTRRTRATLAPLAQATGLTPEVYRAQEPAALASHLRQDYAGKTVVVVGHSNTLLPLLSALGVAPLPGEIRDEEYNYLFKVTLREGQPAKLIMSRYGAAPRAVSAGTEK
ncbi:histidine phosphatase family protein [Hymenobacter sp. BRD128]|uniref:histidine phosphatase family protein n=1 Tax=Hymenobacter sp. BRD128 TaxID=2675878 RepID=UPI0015675AC3|nr:histidine phosphatase family protein [Hymenobacter sp. BRD128]QKG56596.1 histidine phosphatase family protein [Hymenobacter sp. BRD128]